DVAGHTLGQAIQGLVDGGSALGILRHGGPLLVELLGGCPTPTTRQVSGGDRHLNFYEDRDNLRSTTSQERWLRIQARMARLRWAGSPSHSRVAFSPPRNRRSSLSTSMRVSVS